MKERLEKLLNNCYAPISHFGVSSVLVTKDGHYFEGVNVEDASTRAGICAERNAITSFVTAGYKKGDIKEINIMLSSGRIGTPCFVCRQLISEFCDEDTMINCYTKNGEVKHFTVKELCPHPFGEEDLL
jgi:cytidine deaminase